MKMKFIHRPHFTFRAKERKIPLSLAKRTYDDARTYYFDNLRKRHIAIASFEFRNKIRTFAVAYDIIGESIEFVTIHEISQREIENKLRSGRWQHEKN